MTTDENVSKPRRDALKYAAAAIIAGAVAGAGGYYAGGTTQPAAETLTETLKKTVTKTATVTEIPTVGPTTVAPTTVAPTTVAPTTVAPTTPVEVAWLDDWVPQGDWENGVYQTPSGTYIYWGESVAMYTEVVSQYKKDTGGAVDIDFTILPFDVIHTKIIGSQGKGWDVTTHDTMGQRPMKESGVMQWCPIEKIPRWDESVIWGQFVRPIDYLDPDFADQLAWNLWSSWRPDGTLWEYPGGYVPHDHYPQDSKHVDLKSVGVIFNYDTIGYNPDFVPYEEHGKAPSFSYMECFNPEYRGRIGMQNTANITITHVANAMVKEGQWSPAEAPTTNNLRDADLDYVMDYVGEQVKAGQVRAFWTDYGEAVNIFSTQEVWISDCWQPVVMDTRRTATPCYYANLWTGNLYWDIGHMFSKASTGVALERAQRLVNWMQYPWWIRFIARNGYQVPCSTYEDVKDGLGREFWNWQYADGATNQPTSQIIPDTWPDNPEFHDAADRIQQALFLPDRYEWHADHNPVSGGNLKDQGGVAYRMTNIGILLWFADYSDQYIEGFSAMKAEAGLI